MKKRIFVAIATNKGEATLSPLLKSIDKNQERENFDVVICDNGSSDSLISLSKQHNAVLIKEERPGYVHPRNALLAYGLENGYDAMIFVDDDEEVSKEWFSSLTTPYLESNYNYVAGPVYPKFEKNLLNEAPWLQHSKFYQPRQESGQIKKGQIVGCGNVLVDLNFIRRFGLMFDSRFNQIGGEDAEFFFAMQSHKARGFYSAKAKATERLEKERYSYGYFTARSYNLAYAGVLAYKTVFGFTRCLIKYGPRALYHLARGTICRLAKQRRENYKSDRHLHVAKGQWHGLTRRFTEARA